MTRRAGLPRAARSRGVARLAPKWTVSVLASLVAVAGNRLVADLRDARLYVGHAFIVVALDAVEFPLDVPARVARTAREGVVIHRHHARPTVDRAGLLR